MNKKVFARTKKCFYAAIMAMRTLGYSRSELHAFTGVDLRTLDYWAANGTLRASTGGQGKGKHRKFEPEEATLASIFARLSHMGVGQKALSELSAQFHDALDWCAGVGLSGYEIAAANLLQHRREIDATGFSAIPESGLIHFLGRTRAEELPLIGVTGSGATSDPRRGLTWAQVPEYVRLHVPDLPHSVVEECESLDLAEWDRFGSHCIALSHDPHSNAYIEYLMIERHAEQGWSVRFREPKDPDPIDSDACFMINVANVKRQLRGRS